MLATGDERVLVDPSWNTNGRILVRQAWPLPATLNPPDYYGNLLGLGEAELTERRELLHRLLGVLARVVDAQPQIEAGRAPEVHLRRLEVDLVALEAHDEVGESGRADLLGDAEVEPDRDDERMFFLNVFKYRDREAVGELFGVKTPG